MANYDSESQPAIGTSSLSLKKGDDVPPLIKRWWRGDRDKAEGWYDIAKEDFDFPAGRQYTDEELKILRSKKRPDIVFNRTDSVIDAVAGYEVGNRREVRYIPRELGDATANEMLTSAGQWFNDKAGGDYVRSDLFKDLIIGGMGWSETRIDFTESAEGEPREDHIDPFEMTWDRDARQRNLSDATRVWRARRVPLGDAMEMFPGYNKAQLDAAWSSISSEADLKRDVGSKDSSANSTDYVTIIQCQYLTRQPYYLAQDPMTGEQSEFTEAEFNQANKRLKKLAGFEMEGVKFRKKVIKQAFLGGVVLSYGDAPCPDEFSLQCVTGKYDRNKGTWYGIVRAMKDPQRWANKWLSQMMFIMNSNSKGGLIAEKRAFENVRDAEATWAQPDSITTITDGSMGAIKEKTMAPFPVGFQQLTEFAVTSIREVSGVSLELMGTREANQANVLEQSRKQAGLNILQWAFDGMKLYSERQGTVVLYYLQNDLSDGRLIRILGKDNEQYVPLVKQADLEYDIIVDDSPTSPNQKEQIWGIISGFLPLVGKVIPPEFILQALEYSPLPGSVVSKLKDMANAPNPAAQEKSAAEAKQLAADTEETMSKAMLNKANAQKALTPDGAQKMDPHVQSMLDAKMRWNEAILNSLTEIEIQRMKLGQATDADALTQKFEAILHLTGLASDHIQQMRQLAHDRAMQQVQIANQPAQEAVPT